MAYATDTKDREGFDFKSFPIDIAGLIGQYQEPIGSGDDLRHLLQLDPTGRSARQALKDQTGLDLKVDNVLNILDAKYYKRIVPVLEQRDSQYQHYKDLIDLNLYYAALQMFRDNNYGLPEPDEVGNMSPAQLEALMESRFVLTDKLLDMAIEHKDFKDAKNMIDVLSIDHEEYPDIYDDGRRINGKGLLWWLNNGDKEQVEFVIDNNYKLSPLPTDETQITAELIAEFDAIVRKMYQLGYKDQAGELTTETAEFGIWSPFIIDVYYFETEAMREEFADEFLRFSNGTGNMTRILEFIATDPVLKAKAVNALLAADVEQDVIDRFLR